MTIERVECYRTDDGKEFETEYEAIQHENLLNLRQRMNEYQETVDFMHFPIDQVVEFINKYTDEVLDYITNEDRPQRESPELVHKYRDGDDLEAVTPLVVGGELYRQPTDAWNAAIDAVVYTIEQKAKRQASALGMDDNIIMAGFKGVIDHLYAQKERGSNE